MSGILSMQQAQETNPYSIARSKGLKELEQLMAQRAQSNQPTPSPISGEQSIGSQIKSKILSSLLDKTLAKMGL
jgi:hypothetical protein